MRTKFFVIVFTMLALSAKAQQNYFVYVQADQKQPFYVKMNDKLLNSSETGYIVIPKLLPGDYSLTFGFPKDIFPEQTLALKVGNADAGYLLKNFGDKGWGLFNLQTMAVTMSGAAPVKPSVSGDDEFANALSGVSNAPMTITKPVSVNPANADPVKVLIPSVIEKIGGTDATEGRSVIYTDRSGEHTDTIRLFIPTPVTEVKTETVLQETVVPEPEKEKKVLNIEMPDPNSKPAIKDTALFIATLGAKGLPHQNSGKPVVSFNSDCRSNAKDDDFLKIRKKMAAETDEDAMVAVAAKMFKQKCYSTEQVKNLSVLFRTDTGRYKFFDAAYPHTFDTQNFGSLQSELHDEYYVNRFKAMVRN